ncbi:MAG: TIGR04348 family glycosyltransferase [candidate division NC10 bacterium]|nr:TIGR04348 family glycosyltransferase [candidate division NC10 bacterium]
MTICIVTPAPARSRNGNRVTALRWAAILRELGHRVVIEQEYDGRRCDVMVALHARRSFPSVERFRRQFPGAPLLLALTGTDLYDDLRTSGLARRSLELASRLIVLQPLALAELPTHLRDRARVIHQSAKRFPGRVSRAKDLFEVCVLAHLRPVKDPLRAAMAARLLPASSRIRVTHCGTALSEEMGKRARAEAASNPRYRWLGEVPRGKALRILASCRLLVVSSQLEGGANVISEAIAASVPILSSRIPGSMGILGPDYPGYFPVGDTRALASLLARAETDAPFYRALKEWCKQLTPLVRPVRERQAWERLLRELSAGTRNAAGASTPRQRFTLTAAEAEIEKADFGREVEAGLRARPKRLPCRFFYDREGSRLFEAICELPEYYLTRAEREILQARAAEIASHFSKETTLVELGAGSAAKTRILLEAFLRRDGALRYVPVDISRTMLEDASRRLVEEYPTLEIAAIAGEYHDGLRRLKLEADRPRLILWLGSNVGNFERPEAARFVRCVRDTMSPWDRLLVGIDLRKDRAVLQQAYDDSRGVTARFNRNILARINRELGGHFDLETFRHRAVYNEEIGRIEMYLVSGRAQRVSIDRLGLEVPFAAGETIHTENSYKYSFAEIEALAGVGGLRVESQWLDTDRRFSLNLLAPAGS